MVTTEDLQKVTIVETKESIDELYTFMKDEIDFYFKDIKKMDVQDPNTDLVYNNLLNILKLLKENSVNDSHIFKMPIHMLFLTSQKHHLLPITDNPLEWLWITDRLAQNRRNHSICRLDNKFYDLKYYLFYNPEKNEYVTTPLSTKRIILPYNPIPEVIDVTDMQYLKFIFKRFFEIIKMYDDYRFISQRVKL